MGREAFLPLVAQRGVAEYKGLVLVQCGGDEGDRVAVQLSGDVESGNFRSDAAGDLADVSVGGDGSHAACSFVLCWLAGRVRP